METQTTAAQEGIRLPFGELKQVDAGDLSVGHLDAGPPEGTAVVLLHGWPYDIHSYAGVTPILVSAGYRVVVPYLRGYGTTRFLSDDTVRNGQQAALAVDVIALMDALGIGSAIVAGFDWGARSANVVAALWPERVEGLVSVSGYLIGDREVNKAPLPPDAERAWWYQFYFATERGRAGYERYRREFAKLIWQTASPEWDFDDTTFERSAAALDNPDHVDIVIHNYRWRLGVAPRRATVRRPRTPPGRGARDHRADDHAGRGRERRPTSRAQCVRHEVLRQIRASDDLRRYRAQPAARGTAGLRGCGPRGVTSTRSRTKEGEEDERRDPRLPDRRPAGGPRRSPATHRGDALAGPRDRPG